MPKAMVNGIDMHYEVHGQGETTCLNNGLLALSKPGIYKFVYSRSTTK